MNIQTKQRYLPVFIPGIAARGSVEIIPLYALWGTVVEDSGSQRDKGTRPLVV